MTASELAKKYHDPNLAKESHVYQVWHDGEITLQKAGPLLWQRNLHQICPPKLTAAPTPMPQEHGQYSFAFTKCWQAWEIRAAMGPLDALDHGIGKPTIERRED